MSIFIQSIVPIDHALVRVLIAVSVFTVFIYLTDNLIKLFRNNAARKILKELRKADISDSILKTLSGIDEDLNDVAKKLSEQEIEDSLKEKNVLGLLELLNIKTDKLLIDPERKATRKDALKLTIPLIYKMPFGYELRRREFLLELAILMDRNNAGLGCFDSASSKLKETLAYVDANVIKNAYSFLEWSYGINSLFLLSNRDLDNSISTLPVHTKIKIQKLLYKRDQVTRILLAGTMIRIGVIDNDRDSDM